MANHRFQRARYGRQFDAGTGSESRNLLEDAADCVASRSGRQSRPRVRRQEHAKHGDNQSRGKNRYEGAIDSKATPNPADIPSSTNYIKSALDQSLAGNYISTPQT